MTNPTKMQKARAARSAAMPEVKRLVKKHGRAAVAWCVGNLRKHDQVLKKVALLRREAADLEKNL